MKKTHDVAMKVGRPAARQAAQKNNATLCSDCPLACRQLGELISVDLKPGATTPALAHPIEVLARAYGAA
jgi:glycerol-3-phosphate dehydrogenase subunit C